MNITDKLEKLFRLNDAQKKALKKVGIETAEDLLFYFPVRYGNVAKVTNATSLQKGEYVSLYGKISKLKTKKSFRGGVPMAEASFEEASSGLKIPLTWFSQPYIAKMLAEGDLVRIQGEVTLRKEKPTFTNPEIEKVANIPAGVGDSLFAEDTISYAFPVYRETRGITSKWIFHHIQKLFKEGILETLTDAIPADIIKEYNLPSLKTALVWIHTPHKEEDARSAKKRFAFEEIFFIQLEKQKERLLHKQNPSFKISKPESDVAEFVKRFPFTPTKSQQDSITKILSDFRKEYAMSRLLEGDVGSGKTAVAATTAYAVVTTPPKDQDFGNLQVAYMAPTEILASQHFESFIQYFSYLGIQVGLITSSGCKKFPSKVHPTKWTDVSRAQLLKWVKNGEIPILIGTHSLIQKTVEFENLAYVIIDEQHRFGTKQRQKLRKKKDEMLPHLLSMTATPIPRTLALTIYGDLDLTLLDEMPAGRKPVLTKIVLPNGRDETYKHIQKEITNGRQAYVICPRIDEPDPDKENALNLKSVKAEAQRLKKDIFPGLNIDILHGKMNKKEKEETMSRFADGEINILVATSVVEVGVNVPNATNIIIEGAERFGLAQLHQLRGRVVRSTHQAHCFVFTDSANTKTKERLNALVTAKNGFELAELDMKQRGIGLLSGQKQWGVSDLAMEAIQNTKMVEAARNEAVRIIETDPDLKQKRFATLKEKLERKNKVHFE